MNFLKIAILGPGLLGGSLALVLRKKMPGVRIDIWARRQEAVEEIQATGLADIASTELEPVVTGADLVIFCVPIGAMPPLAEKIVPYLSETAVVTDVGSVKKPVVEALGAIFGNRARFVGSHPMAGSEQSGLSAARADLFEESVCIITPVESTAEADVAAIAGFWSALGCKVSVISPLEHDEIITMVSHLPHLLAATLVNLVCSGNPNWLNFCGNGFRDTTRVASGPPEMWSEILQTNRESLKKSIVAMIEKLGEVLALLEASNEAGMKHFLNQAKIERDRLKARK